MQICDHTIASVIITSNGQHWLLIFRDVFHLQISAAYFAFKWGQRF